MLHLIKMGVGLLLMISFACPLAVVVVTPSLWEEPMVLLVVNLAVSDFAFGMSLAAIGLVEMLPVESTTLCAWVMYASYGIAMIIKMMHLLLAMDQFIAIRFSLRYYELMNRVVYLLIALSWTVAMLHLTIGMVLFNFDLETTAERHIPMTNGTQQLKGCRYETVVPIIFQDMFEVELLMLSFSSAGLFIYTAYVGMKQKARIFATRAEITRDLESHSFFANYRAFRKLLRVILLTLLLDGLALVQRRVNLYYPMPQLNGLIHQLRLSLLLIEFWVYAMASVKLRDAFRKTIGCGFCCGQDDPGQSAIAGSSCGGAPGAVQKLQRGAAVPPSIIAVRPDILQSTADAWNQPDEHSRPI